MKGVTLVPMPFKLWLRYIVFPGVRRDFHVVNCPDHQPVIIDMGRRKMCMNCGYW